VVKCSECGCEISDNVEACPVCRAPVTVSKRAAPPIDTQTAGAFTGLLVLIERALRTAQKLGCLFHRHDNIATGIHEGAGQNDLFSALLPTSTWSRLGRADNKVGKPSGGRLSE
jgi:hypothetical protein